MATLFSEAVPDMLLYSKLDIAYYIYRVFLYLKLVCVRCSRFCLIVKYGKYECGGLLLVAAGSL